MLKRVVSFFVVACMAFSIAGCSANGLGYLNLVSEVNSLDSYEFTSNLSLNFSNEVKEMLTDGLNIEDLNVSVNGKVNMEKSFMSLDMNISDSKKVFSADVSLYCTEDGVFVPTDNLLKLYNLYLITFENYTPEMADTLKNKLAVEFSTVDYICLDKTNVFERIDFTSVIKELYITGSDTDKAFIDVIGYIFSEDYLKGVKFDDSIIRKINNGYELTLTPEKVYDIVKSFVENVKNNEGSILKVFLTDDMIAFVNEVDDRVNFGIDDMMFPQGEEPRIDVLGIDDLMFPKGEEPRIDISGIDDMMFPKGEEPRIDVPAIVAPKYTDEEMYALNVKNTLDTISSIADGFKDIDLDATAVIKDLKGTKFVSTISKTKGGYSSAVTLDICYQNISMITVKSSATVVVKDVTPISITGVYIDDISDIWNKVEYQVNPVIEVIGDWYDYEVSDDNSIVLRATRDNGNFEVDDYPFYIIEDRIYLPLRKICENFGEEVEWNAVESKAYIVRGSEKIDMTGVIKNDRTYIKIRDFEKLGYEVGYSEDGIMKTMTLVNR